MATRDIKTRLKLEGEAEYKRSLGELDASLKTLKTEMNKVSAEYEGNANSIEALSAKNEVYEKQLEVQRKKVESLKEVLAKAAEAWGENDKRTQAWAQKANNAEAELYKMEHQLQRNQEAMDKLNGETDEGSSALGIFGDDLKEAAGKLGVQLPEGAQKAVDKLGQLHPKALLVVSVFTALSKAIKEVNDKLQETTGHSAEYYYELEKLSEITGLSTQRLQEFEYAAGQLNIPMDRLSDSLKDVTNKAYEAANGNDDLAEQFRSLGVVLEDSHGQLRNSYDIFLDLIDALDEMENQTERDATAMKLINEGARELNPLIDAGSASLKKYSEEAQKMGAVLSNEQVEAIVKVKEAQLELEAAQKAVSDQMAAEYAPFMEDGLKMTSELVLAVGDAFDKSNIVHSLGSIALSVASLLEPLAEIGTALLPPILYLLEPIAGLFAWIADTANATLGVLGLPLGLVTAAFDGGALLGSSWNRLNTAWGNYELTGEYSNLQKWRGADENFDWNSWQAYDFNAAGTRNYKGGLTWVGENGPELMSLPAGSRIYSAQESREMGGDVINIYISAKDTKEYNDLVAMAKDARLMARMKGD